MKDPISDFIKVDKVRLHYLDWGGEGPVLLFLAGLGNTAHIFNRFAPRFTDRFHVLGLTRRGHGDSDCPETGYDAVTLTGDVLHFIDALGIKRVTLVGHSMANLELVTFSKMAPQRLDRLIFLDSAYDRTMPAYREALQRNPLKEIAIPGADVEHTTIEGYISFLKTAYPTLAAVWDEVMEEETRHIVKRTPEGKVIERMPETVGKALSESLYGFKPDNACIRVPTLAFYVFQNGAHYLADYMTPEQQAKVIDFVERIRPPTQQACIDQFRRDVPQARVVILEKGHHYCFLSHAEFVYREMLDFMDGSVMSG